MGKEEVGFENKGSLTLGGGEKVGVRGMEARVGVDNSVSQ